MLNLILCFASCGSVEKAFSNQKKNSNDEFLVEKKSPLIMPPDYNDLPIPKINKNENISSENEFKAILKIEEKESINTDMSKDENKGLVDSLLEKIKNKR